MKIICPKCVQESDMDAKFCQNCGFNFDKTGKKHPTCSICHKIYDDGSLFCPKDGGIISIESENTSQGRQYVPKRKTREQELESFDGIYPKGDLGNRFGATILDMFVCFGLTIPTILLVIIGINSNSYSNSGSQFMFFGLGILCFLIPLFYSFTKDGMQGGQSIGKKACGLMVVNLDTHEPCDKGKSALRHLISSLVSSVPYLGWIVEPVMVLANEDGRKLGDKAANTQVVDVKVYHEYQTYLKNQENQ
jgi:uncharacterized RDD family membrane protein YckC